MSSGLHQPSAPEAGGDNAAGAGPRDRKSGLSCAECRRSKLKCDRVFPCQSCIRRGCSAICPDGTLAATKGNKVLMAHAQKLSQQVKSMSARIKELEHALSETQAGTLHPLLRELHGQSALENIDTRSTPESDEVDPLSDVVGSLSIGSDGRSKFHGETAGAEYLRSLLPDTAPTTRARDPRYLGIPAEFIELSNAFPFGIRDTHHLHLQFLTFIPSRERAEHLANLYFVDMSWLFNPVPRKEMKEEILDVIYASDGTVSVLSIHSHRLSVFFGILALGAHADTHPSAALLSEQYHALARAAYSIQPIANEATLASVQALFLVSLFLWRSDRSTNELRWLMSGLTGKLIQTLGLQRDSANWDFGPEEIQRRRRLFWEYFGWECWLSIVNGRPPTLSLEHSDCRFPEDEEPIVSPSGEIEFGWYAAKHRFTASCLAATITRAFTVQRHNYPSLFELHDRMRNFRFAVELQCPIDGADPRAAWGSHQERTMQQLCLLSLREAALIYVHRSYLAQALREAPNDPLSHKYGRSVVAAYKSANNLLHGLRGGYAAHPGAVGRFWFFWTAAFSACITLGVIVTESPGCSLAPSALADLNELAILFEEGSAQCRPANTTAVLSKLQKRAYHAYVNFHKTSDPTSHRQQQENSSDMPDDIEVMGFKKKFIKESPSTSPQGSDKSASPAARGQDSEANIATMTALNPDIPAALYSRGYPTVVGAPAYVGYQVEKTASQGHGYRPKTYPQPGFYPSIGQQAGPSSAFIPNPTSSLETPFPFNVTAAPEPAPQYSSTSASYMSTETQEQLQGSIGNQMDAQQDFINNLFGGLTPTLAVPQGPQGQDDMWWSLVQELGLTS